MISDLSLSLSQRYPQLHGVPCDDIIKKVKYVSQIIENGKEKTILPFHLTPAWYVVSHMLFMIEIHPGGRDIPSCMGHPVMM